MTDLDLLKVEHFFQTKFKNSSLARQSQNITTSTLNEREATMSHQGPPADTIQFPSTRNILWDRTSLSEPKFMKPSNIFPTLFLRNDDIHLVLSNLVNCSIKGLPGFDLKAQVVDTIKVYESLNADTQRIPVYFSNLSGQLLLLKNSDIDYSFHYDKIDANLIGDREVTIPFKLSSSDFSFDSESTQLLIDNLSKSLVTSRVFSLRSTFRIRAIGNAKRIEGGGFSGKIRFEVITPTLMFDAIQIRQVPVFMSPLSHSLMGNELGYQGPKFGYLSLNQTRKVVPLTEIDPLVLKLPLIGVWILSDGVLENEDITSNAVAWSACLKYYYSENIRERVYVDQEKTFLLTIFCSSGYSCYEISPKQSHSQELENFMRMDFTVELTSPEFVHESSSSSSPKVSRPVACRFRPMIKKGKSGGTVISRSIESNEIKNNEENLEMESINIPANRELSMLNWTEFEGLGKPKIIEESVLFDRATPQPRLQIPIPSPSHRLPIKTNTFKSIEANSSSELPPPSRFDLIPPTLRSSISKFQDGSAPFEIIAMQQQQIDKLQEEIKVLKELVLSLTFEKKQIDSDKNIPAMEVINLQESTESSSAKIQPTLFSPDSLPNASLEYSTYSLNSLSSLRGSRDNSLPSVRQSESILSSIEASTMKYQNQNSAESNITTKSISSSVLENLKRNYETRLSNAISSESELRERFSISEQTHHDREQDTVISSYVEPDSIREIQSKYL